jgi:hypothetical protein
MENHTETAIRAMERNALNALAPFNEMMNQSRACFEKGFATMREETIGLLNRMHDLNGEMLAEYQNGPNIQRIAAAQEKWLTEFSRDLYNASLRMHESARHLMAESFEGVGQSIRTTAKNGADAVEEAVTASEQAPNG